MSNYKPCPFCGSEEITAWYRGSRYGRIAYIQCDLCGSQTKAFQYNDSGEEFNEDDLGYKKALAAWNRRANA